MEKNIQHLQGLLDRARANGAPRDDILRLEGAVDFAVKLDEKYVLVLREKRSKEMEWRDRVVRILESIVTESPEARSGSLV